MTISHSRLAYADCYRIMDAALADERGVKIKFTDEKHATFFRMRCHQARAIERRESKEIYDKGDLHWGVSQHERLILRIRPDGDLWWVLIEQAAVSPGDIVSLTTGERLDVGLPQIEYQPQRQLPPPQAPTDDALAEAFDNITAVADDKVEILPPKPTFRRL